jgi:hypothetical protein
LTAFDPMACVKNSSTRELRNGAMRNLRETICSS